MRYFIKDELTAQVNNFYSNAIGGVKLQVYDHEELKATNILIQGGFIKISTSSTNIFIPKIEKLTSKLPFIGDLLLEKRLLIIASAILVLIFIPIAIIGLYVPLKEKIVNRWCIDELTYQENRYYPIHNAKADCSYNLQFRDDGIVDLPEFGNTYGRAKWYLDNSGKLVIYKSDTMGFVYDGIYNIDLIDNNTILMSENTKIMGHLNLSNNDDILFILYN